MLPVACGLAQAAQIKGEDGVALAPDGTPDVDETAPAPVPGTETEPPSSREPAAIADRYCDFLLVGDSLGEVERAIEHELRVMRDQGRGAIVNCSSLGGLVGLPQRAAYHGTKHAVLGMTKSAGVEYAPRQRCEFGVRDPGPIADHREPGGEEGWPCR